MCYACSLLWLEADICYAQCYRVCQGLLCHGPHPVLCPPARLPTPDSCRRPAATGAAMIWLIAIDASMTEYATVM